jgi:hypothetical protein
VAHMSACLALTVRLVDAGMWDPGPPFTHAISYLVCFLQSAMCLSAMA